MTDVFLSPSAATSTDIALTLIEFGAAIVGLAVLSRLATRIGLAAIPLYLLAGLAFGKGGLLPLALSQDFVHLGAEIGVILLLFMLSLEYTGEELSASLRGGLLAGIVDLVLNFVLGLIAGYLLGWSLLACILLGGCVIGVTAGALGRTRTATCSNVIALHECRSLSPNPVHHHLFYLNVQNITWRNLGQIVR